MRCVGSGAAQVTSLVSRKDRTTCQNDVQPWLPPIKCVDMSLGTGRTASPVAALTIFAHMSGE